MQAGCDSTHSTVDPVELSQLLHFSDKPDSVEGPLSVLSVLCDSQSAVSGLF